MRSYITPTQSEQRPRDEARGKSSAPYHRSSAEPGSLLIAVTRIHDAEDDEKAKRDEPHVRDRRVGDEFLHVASAPVRRNRCKPPRSATWSDDQPVEFAELGVGRDRQAETQETVTTDLQHASPPGSPSLPVGASTCASGSQVCTGHIGTLTANAIRKAPGTARICPARTAAAGGNVENLRSCGLRSAEVHVNQRDQHQHRADEGI